MFALFGNIKDDTFTSTQFANITQRAINCVVQNEQRFVLRTSLLKLPTDDEYIYVYTGNITHVVGNDRPDIILDIASLDDLAIDKVRKYYWNRLGQYIMPLKNRLLCLHKFLNFNNKSQLNDELVEQLETLEFFTGDERVLELGGNVGRNSVVIASVLNDDRNLVVIEPGHTECELMAHNKKVNNMEFHIVEGALSYRPIFKDPRSWVSTVEENHSEACVSVNTMTYEQIKETYGIEFDTLVIDCEGAFYYILLDSPGILEGIKMIMLENDFDKTTQQKQYVHGVLAENGFKVVKNTGIDVKWWGKVDDFWQVYKKE